MVKQDTVWNFLVPALAEPSVEFRWTGSNAYVNGKRVVMSTDRHPHFTYCFPNSEAVITLSRNIDTHTKQCIDGKWILKLDGSIIEHKVKLSKDGVRPSLRNMKEGSYTIATHYSPTIHPPCVVYTFLQFGSKRNIEVGHDQISGKVEVVLDGKVICGRERKFIDNGLTLKFDILPPDNIKVKAKEMGIAVGIVNIKPKVLGGWTYTMKANDITIDASFETRTGSTEHPLIEIQNQMDIMAFQRMRSSSQDGETEKVTDDSLRMPGIWRNVKAPEKEAKDTEDEDYAETSKLD